MNFAAIASHRGVSLPSAPEANSKGGGLIPTGGANTDAATMAALLSLLGSLTPPATPPGGGTGDPGQEVG